MPRKTIDYSKNVIYKIEHNDDDTLQYIGHTTNWDKRKCEHKHRCNNGQSDKHNLKLYQMIRENGGWDKFRMLEVEKYPCLDRREADKRETEIMKELKSNMNMVKSYLSEEEKSDYKKKANIKYYEGHKTTISEQGKTYRQNNRGVILQRKKEYYAKNKDKICEIAKEKIKCECGCEVVKYKLNRHQTTKKHIELMNKFMK